MSMNSYQIPIYTTHPYGANDRQNLIQENSMPQIPYNQIQGMNNLYSYPAQYYTNNIVQSSVLPNGVKTRSETGKWKLDGIEKTPYGDNIYKYTLKNGQTVALMPRENATTIIKTFVNAGSMNENDYNRGISHFNEHNVFNGSEHLVPGRFFKEVGKLGAETNASTDYAQTDFYIESPIVDDKTLKRIIELHSDMLTRPLFPKDMVEKERGPVTSEISMCNDNVANRATNDLIRNLFQINSKSDDMIAGSIATVNNMTRDDVYNHWKKHFTPDNMYTVLTGDFNPNDAIEIISDNFTTPYVQNADKYRTKEKLTPIQNSIRCDYISPTDGSTNVFCAFAGEKPNDTKANITGQALNILLFADGMRFQKNTSDMYVYGNRFRQKVGLEKDDPEALIFQFATQGGQDSKAIDKFYDTVKSVVLNPPTDEEMRIVKNTLLKSLASKYEDTEGITNLIGTSLLAGNFDDISEYKNIITSLSAKDITDYTDKYLDFGKMSVSVVHPYNMTPDEIFKNYNKSEHKKVQSTNTNQISFKGRKPVSTQHVEEISLPDNATVALNDINSENCYLDWRLSCKNNTPKNPACSYVLTQILNDGSKYKSKSDFLYDASLKSVYFDTDANSFQIRTKSDCLYTNLNDGINAMKEAIYAPRFTDEDFKVAVDKIRTYCSSMNKDASTNLLAELYGKYFPSPSQILEGLNTLTIDDVKNHYNNLIFNSSSNFVVSAPFSKHPELRNQTLSQLNTNNVKFKPYAPKLLKSYSPNPREKVLLDTEERNQAQIYKNYSFEISGNIEDEIKFELLNTILGGGTSSRLFSDLREKRKLAYTTSSQIQSFENSGILTMRILSTTDDKKQNDIKYDNLKKCLDGFKENTDRLMTEEVSDEEFESAKMQLKQDIALQMELPDVTTSLLSMNMTQPYGIRRIDEYVKAIDKITKKDIKDAANHVFSNKPVYSILASSDTINNQMNYINSLGEVVRL